MIHRPKDQGPNQRLTAGKDPEFLSCKLPCEDKSLSSRAFFPHPIYTGWSKEWFCSCEYIEFIPTLLFIDPCIIFHTVNVNRVVGTVGSHSSAQPALLPAGLEVPGVATRQGRLTCIPSQQQLRKVRVTFVAPRFAGIETSWLLFLSSFIL